MKHIDCQEGDETLTHIGVEWMQSLPGQSQIDSVLFDQLEEVRGTEYLVTEMAKVVQFVVGGSRGGGIKVWDFSTEKGELLV